MTTWLYRIHFPDSVSGPSVGDSVKFRGIDVGTVKSMNVDPDNTRLVLVDVRLRKDAPIKTDTRASLALKGITGVVFIELNGGDPAAKSLLGPRHRIRSPRSRRKRPVSKPCSMTCPRWCRNSRP